MRNTLSLQLGSSVLMAFNGDITPPILNLVTRTVYNPDSDPFTIQYEPPFTNGETVYDTATALLSNGTFFFLTTSWNPKWLITSGQAISSTFAVSSYRLYANALGKSDEPSTFFNVYSTGAGPAIGMKLFRNTALTIPVSAQSDYFEHGHGYLSTSTTGAITSIQSPARLLPCFTDDLRDVSTPDIYTVDTLLSFNTDPAFCFYNNTMSLPVTANFTYGDAPYYFVVNPINGSISNIVYSQPISRINGWTVGGLTPQNVAFPVYDSSLYVGRICYIDNSPYYTPLANTTFKTAAINDDVWVTDDQGAIIGQYYISTVTPECGVDVPFTLLVPTDSYTLAHNDVRNATDGTPFTGVAVQSNVRYTYVDGAVTSYYVCPT